MYIPRYSHVEKKCMLHPTPRSLPSQWRCAKIKLPELRIKFCGVRPPKSQIPTTIRHLPPPWSIPSNTSSSPSITMVNTLLKAALPLAVIAFLYQAIISDLVFVVLGVGRTIDSINSFPYQCYRIEDPRIQACEDMWLSDATRQLFLACSEPLARSQWMPK